MEIPLEDVHVLPDGTLAYKNQRVVLYIRDIRHYRNRSIGDDGLSRFHVSNCEKLKEMRAHKRYDRYVVATRDTGIFQINLMSEAGKFEKADRQLNVCQFCLGTINWQDFVEHRKYKERRAEIVSSFKLQMFFTRYGKTFISESPKYTEETGPLNDYDKNFQMIAQKIKEKRGYRCAKCGSDLSNYKKYLHAHHVNGLKYDNSESNIELLCIGEHARQPYHIHVKWMSEYKEFFQIVRPKLSKCAAKGTQLK
jgi:hypothetical protein